MPENFIQLPAEGTGKRLRTHSFAKQDGSEVHAQYVVISEERQSRGVYVTDYVGAVRSAVHGANEGFLYVFNPVGSNLMVGMRRVQFLSLPVATFGLLQSPRIAAERFTATGTASGTALPVAKIDTASPDAACRVVTAGTGLTATMNGAALATFFVAPVISGIGSPQPVPQEYYPPLKARATLRPGEGLVVRQTDAGASNDNRKIMLSFSWEEYTV
jgi:hypothetical protein